VRVIALVRSAPAFPRSILPPYARRSKSLEVLIPILYLKGVSTGGFEEALTALLGKDAGGLSATTVGRAQVGLVAGARALEGAALSGNLVSRLRTIRRA
jgi:hypothetical protein